MYHTRRARLSALVCFLLTALLLLSSCEWIGKTDPEETKGESWRLAGTGVSVPVPQAYAANTDKIYMEPLDELYEDEGVSFGYVALYPAPYDEIEQMSEDEIYALIDQASYPVMFFGIDGGRGDAELLSWLTNDGWEEPESMTRVGTAGEWSFFRVAFAGMRKTYDGETETIAASVYEALADGAQFEFFEPSAGEPVSYGVSGNAVSFETTDLDGNPVNSAELFSANRITVVNLWASWCGPCVRELPELEELNRRLKEKGCAVVSILCDGDTVSGREDGADVAASAGVTYPILLPNADIFAAFPLDAYPTTYFVDSDGCIVGDVIVGAYVERYEDQVNSQLQRPGN